VRKAPMAATTPNMSSGPGSGIEDINLPPSSSGFL
jgi:hypothetical protein